MEFPGAGQGSSGLESRDFLKLKSGENVKGVFRGNPYKFYTHWTGKFSQECGKDSGESCEFCAGGDKPRFRFRINFFVENTNGSFTPRVFEQGKVVYDLLGSLHGVDYDLEKTRVRISRSGSGIEDTVYTIVPLPNGLLTPQQEKEILSTKLLDLTSVKVETPHLVREQIMKAVGSDSEDLPF